MSVSRSFESKQNEKVAFLAKWCLDPGCGKNRDQYSGPGNSGSLCLLQSGGAPKCYLFHVGLRDSARGYVH